MRKQVDVSLPDLFNLKPLIRDQILAEMKKTERTTSGIMAKTLKISPESVRKNLNLLVDIGTVSDLGIFSVQGRKVRVYELVNRSDSK